MMEYNYLKKVGMTSNNNINKICQSCGKPINKPDEYGKNSDGSQNNDYCGYCFRDGNFTNPNITMEYMIDIAAILTANVLNISEKEAIEKTKITIPKLKRWQSK